MSDSWTVGSAPLVATGHGIRSSEDLGRLEVLDASIVDLGGPLPDADAYLIEIECTGREQVDSLAVRYLLGRLATSTVSTRRVVLSLAHRPGLYRTGALPRLDRVQDLDLTLIVASSLSPPRLRYPGPLSTVVLDARIGPELLVAAVVETAGFDPAHCIGDQRLLSHHLGPGAPLADVIVALVVHESVVAESVLAGEPL